MKAIGPVYPLPESTRERLSPLCTGDGTLSWEAFTQAALYHPAWGYYCTSRTRVGKNPEADFYTASTHNLVFPRLLLEATQSLLHGMDMRDFHWVEIGAESRPIANESFRDQFASCTVLRLGDRIEIPAPAVVFSNELFDAQPFHRWIHLENQWRPISIALSEAGIGEVIDETPLTEEEGIMRRRLPAAACEGYRIDLSLAAERLMDRIAAATPRGLILAIDYGKSWERLIHDTPQGTARAYRHHHGSGDLLLHPGEQDLTCDVCWDFLADVLRNRGFGRIELARQESFFMHKASHCIQEIVSRPGDLTHKVKGQLMELISPAHFGSRFQVLSASLL